MKTISILLLFLTSTNYFFSQNNLSEVYNEGVIHGQFKSWYTNGQLKVIGSYDNNVKIGVWSVWDSLGNQIMKREYGDNHKLSIETYHNNIIHVKQSIDQEAIVRNEEGFLPFIEMNADDILYSQRLWCKIGATEMNKELFENNHFYNELVDLIENGKIKGYAAKSDQFETVLESNEVDMFKGKTILGYKVKEDRFFDKSRNCSETRIIGICPIIEVNGAEMESFWIYYPEVRKHLAKLELDDTFFFHQFNNEIIRESNVSGKYISEYIEPRYVSDEILRIESQNIETEISFWIQFAAGV